MYSYRNDYQFSNNAPVTEPVTLAEAKLYCRVTTSTEDALIESIITQARESIELATNLSLIPRQVEVWFNNEAGNFDLPFGPVTYFLSLYDNNEDEIPSNDYKLIGGAYPKVKFPTQNDMKATYNAGFDCIPKDLKIAILDQVSYDYENRGLDANSGICEKTWRACQRWTKTSPIL
jgi:uncharacterized phiE125 gp8 family phage protein